MWRPLISMLGCSEEVSTCHRHKATVWTIFENAFKDPTSSTKVVAYILGLVLGPAAVIRVTCAVHVPDFYSACLIWMNVHIGIQQSVANMSCECCYPTAMYDVGRARVALIGCNELGVSRI